MPSKKTDTTPFDLASLRRAPRFIWREVERDHVDGEDPRPPIRVKLRDLGISETNAIPIGIKTPLSECLQVIAPHVVEWDFQAENLNTGKIIDVPAPAEAGWEVVELLSEEDAGAIIIWLKFPHGMRAASEKESTT